MAIFKIQFAFNFSVNLNFDMRYLRNARSDLHEIFLLLVRLLQLLPKVYQILKFHVYPHPSGLNSFSSWIPIATGIRFNTSTLQMMIIWNCLLLETSIWPTPAAQYHHTPRLFAELLPAIYVTHPYFDSPKPMTINGTCLVCYNFKGYIG